MVDKYSWVDLGSSYLMNDIVLLIFGEILKLPDEINENRLNTWQKL